MNEQLDPGTKLESEEKLVSDAAYLHLRDKGLKGAPRVPLFVQLNMSKRPIGSAEITLDPGPEGNKQTSFVVFPDAKGNGGWAYDNPVIRFPEEDARQASFKEGVGRRAVKENGKWIVNKGGLLEVGQTYYG